MLMVDFFGINAAVNWLLFFQGSAAAETVIVSHFGDRFPGFANDTISYVAEVAGIAVDLRTDAVSGGIAQGDTITGFGNAKGSSGDDLFVGGTIPSGGTLTFLAGETRTSVSVDITGGFDAEQNEFIRFNIVNPITVRTSNGAGFATVTNDDTFDPTLGISDAGSQDQGDSGATVFTFEVTRTGILSQASSASFTVTGVTVDAADFAGGVLPSGEVVCAANEDTATIVLQVQGALDAERGEGATLTLSDADGARPWRPV
jgi:hypothetical protein